MARALKGTKLVITRNTPSGQFIRKLPSWPFGKPDDRQLSARHDTFIVLINKNCLRRLIFKHSLFQAFCTYDRCLLFGNCLTGATSLQVDRVTLSVMELMAALNRWIARQTTKIIRINMWSARCSDWSVTRSAREGCESYAICHRSTLK